MTSEEFKLRWQYFLSIDDEFSRTDNYVYHDGNNLSTYSVEFLELLMLACSEFEMMCKLIYKHTHPDFDLTQYINICEFSKKVLQECQTIKDFEITTPIYEHIKPLGNWDVIEEGKKKKVNLTWWIDYNNVKHNHHENFEKANLENALNAIASLYVLFLYMAFKLDDEECLELLMQAKSVRCRYTPQPLRVSAPEIPPGFDIDQ